MRGRIVRRSVYITSHSDEASSSPVLIVVAGNVLVVLLKCNMNVKISMIYSNGNVPNSIYSLVIGV